MRNLDEDLEIEYLQNEDRIKFVNYVLFFSLGYISVISVTTKSLEKSTKKVANDSSASVFGFSFKCASPCTCMHTHTLPHIHTPTP